ncbi:hypothetical protein V5O48_012399 [Marasmius crinis-equi]|uniref:Uncharacterized protein n=1 Tax=Marasmius crinis-equi TaxID=585013 RepID=A0ABR3F385_9AGAR
MFNINIPPPLQAQHHAFRRNPYDLHHVQEHDSRQDELGQTFDNAAVLGSHPRDADVISEAQIKSDRENDNHDSHRQAASCGDEREVQYHMDEDDEEVARGSDHELDLNSWCGDEAVPVHPHGLMITLTNDNDLHVSINNHRYIRDDDVNDCIASLQKEDKRIQDNLFAWNRLAVAVAENIDQDIDKWSGLLLDGVLLGIQNTEIPELTVDN